MTLNRYCTVLICNKQNKSTFSKTQLIPKAQDSSYKLELNFPQSASKSSPATQHGIMACCQKTKFGPALDFYYLSYWSELGSNFYGMDLL